MLPKAHRLTSGRDYARLRHEGRSRGHPLIVLVYAPNGASTSRVGLTVGGKVGSAVARNRARRLLREAVRGHLGDVRPGFDVVLIARSGLATARLSEVAPALESLLRRAGLIVPGGTSGVERTK